MADLERPHFETPPLKEAVFDLLVDQASAPIDDSSEKAFFALLPDYDSNRQEYQQFQATWRFQAGKPDQGMTLGTASIRQWNKDRSRSVLFGPTNLAFNVLPPYGKYEDHAPQLRKIIASYFAVRPNSKALALGHRYINQIVVPLDRDISPAKLFTLYPKLPAGAAARHPPLAVQLETARFENGVVLTTLSLAAADAETAVYVIDIYARTTATVPETLDGIMDWHSAAHSKVVESFLFAITSDARALFKEKGKEPA